MLLIQPTSDLESTHRTFLKEFTAAGERVVPWIVGKPYDTFASYVAMLDAASKGIGIAPGFVAHSTFWLIDDAREIVAIANLRHALTDALLKHSGHIGYGVRPSRRRQGHATEILRQTLLEAKKLGIHRARLTCDKANLPSAKTILHNGGELDEEEFMAEHQEVISRYWISL